MSLVPSTRHSPRVRYRARLTVSVSTAGRTTVSAVLVVVPSTPVTVSLNRSGVAATAVYVALGPGAVGSAMSGNRKVGLTAVALLSVTTWSAGMTCPSTLGICSHLYEAAPMLSEPSSVTFVPRCTVWAAPGRAVTTASGLTTCTLIDCAGLRPESPIATTENS